MIAATARIAARLVPRTDAPAGVVRGWRLALGYLAIAVLARLIMLGHPTVQVDEQFYLLVGQRMAQGALPYVDLWDRKPLGLFLLYRAAFLTPSFDPVLVYQVAGIVFSVATALIIARMARLIAPARGAALAGLAYLLYQPTFNVALGQSPVFYNLPVALAVLVVARARLRDGGASLLPAGCLAMLLLGLAIQIKYTVVFEGIGLGLLLLAHGRAAGWPAPRLIAAAALWIAVALSPTLAAWGWYALGGYGAAFVQANFLSIFGRVTDWNDALWQLAKEALALLPFALAIAAGLRDRGLAASGSAPAALPTLGIWMAFALGGFLLVAPWYDHYLGPVLVPLAVLAAPALGGGGPGLRWRTWLLLGFGALGAIIAPAFQRAEHGSPAAFTRVTALVRRELHGRCLYVFEGDSALYRTTGACLPGRFVFPSHLDAMNEAGALGVSALGEVRRIMASRPGVVVMAESRRPNLPNLQTRAAVNAALKRDYQRYARIRLGTRRYGLYRLRNQAVDRRTGAPKFAS